MVQMRAQSAHRGHPNACDHGQILSSRTAKRTHQFAQPLPVWRPKVLGGLVTTAARVGGDLARVGLGGLRGDGDPRREQLRRHDLHPPPDSEDFLSQMGR